MAHYAGVAPGAAVILLPGCCDALAAHVALGLGLIAAAAERSVTATSGTSCRWRVQLLLFASPVAYSRVRGAAERSQMFYSLNPLSRPARSIPVVACSDAGSAAGGSWRATRSIVRDRRCSSAARIVVRRMEQEVRRCHLTVAIAVERPRQGLHDPPPASSDTDARRGAAAAAAASVPRAPSRDVLGARRTSRFDVDAGRGRRHHRPQRRGQEHAAQDPQPHHRADRRAASTSTAASAACSRSAPASTPSSPAARTSILNGAILGMTRRRDRRASSTRSSTSPASSSSSTRPVKRYSAACTCVWPSRSRRTWSPRS